MLKEKLMDDLKESMKNKDAIRKNTIQMVRAAILQIEKDKGIEVEDDKILELQEYLPKQLSREEIKSELEKIIAEIGATSMKDMGTIMKEAKAKMGASAEGKIINEVAKEIMGL